MASGEMPEMPSGEQPDQSGDAPEMPSGGMQGGFGGGQPGQDMTQPGDGQQSGQTDGV
jgi:hypothetical protein